MAGFSATAYLQVASVLGVLTGGMVADAWVRKDRRGRMFTQAVGLFAGVPFLLMTGWAFQVTVFVFATIGFGFFKGMYDANIWASSARRGAAGAARHGGRPDELDRLAGRRRGAGGDRVGVGSLGNGRVPERDVGDLRGGGVAAGAGVCEVVSGPSLTCLRVKVD